MSTIALAGRLLGLRQTRVTLNLALQGGGAHGAFTWGVLDSLLADPNIEFEGLSGSSAGAMQTAQGKDVRPARGWFSVALD